MDYYLARIIINFEEQHKDYYEQQTPKQQSGRDGRDGVGCKLNDDGDYDIYTK